MRDLARVYDRKAALIGVLLLATAIVAHRLTPEQSSMLFDSLVQSLHGPGFALLTLLMFWLIGPSQSAGSRYLITTATVAGIAVFSEAAQIPGPRDAQLGDLVADALGATGALAGIAVFDLRHSLTRNRRMGVAILSLAALSATFTPVAWFAYVSVEQQRALPVLLSFENRWESAIYSQTEAASPVLVPAPDGWPDSGETVAYSHENGRWGILLRLHPYPDWRGFSELSFVVTSGTEQSQMIVVAVRDTRPKGNEFVNRFYQEFETGPEPRRYRIPFDALLASADGRPFDLAHIKTVVFSAASPGGDTSMLIDDVRLER